jgi:hypothetical protein
VACDQCDEIVDAAESGGIYTIRSCKKCGREIKVRESGKHGIGVEIRKGDRVVVPSGFIRMAANPLKGGGNFTRHGLTWFSEIVFADDITANRTDFGPYLDRTIEKLDQFLRASKLLKDIDFDDPIEDALYKCVEANKGTAEWFAFVAANLFSFARESIKSNNVSDTAWSVAAAERFRSLWIFKEYFEDVVWMGHSAKRLTDVLSLWKANQTNSDEEFWQIKLHEASYVFSQIFSVPVTLIQDKAYVGGQQIDGKSARFVDFLFSGGTSGEAMLIEIKTPVTRLLQRTKYRSNVYAPTSDVTGAVVQAADYRDSFSRSLRDAIQNKGAGLTAFNPKAVIIVGNYAAELDTEEKRRSFELYRSSLSNIEILTFDELFRKMEYLAKLFNLVKSDGHSEA